MAFPAKKERNAAIVRAYLSGRKIPDIAAEHGICSHRARFIIQRAGVLGTPEERKERHRQICRLNQARPDVKQRKAERMRRHWQTNPNMGRPRLFADDPQKREEYLLLRSVMGAAYARQAMGLESAA